MEDNVSSALTMAGSILLFVIGLAVCMLSFSQAREAIDTILAYSDRETTTIEGDSRYYYLSNSNDTSRYVGLETIIPTIYRAYKENYKIVFKFPDENYYIFKNKKTPAEVFTKIDLREQAIANDLASRQFLNGIVYGIYTPDLPGDKDNLKQRYIDYFRIEPYSSKPLYQYLNEKLGSYRIKECLGTYYLEDIDKTQGSEIQESQTRSIIMDAEKTEKRVITYIFEPK